LKRDFTDKDAEMKFLTNPRPDKIQLYFKLKPIVYGSSLRCGTVPTISATPYEWTKDQIDSAVYFVEQHASLQNFNPALVQIGRLLGNIGL